jgi:hypothetical protein
MIYAVNYSFCSESKLSSVRPELAEGLTMNGIWHPYFHDSMASSRP